MSSANRCHCSGSIRSSTRAAEQNQYKDGKAWDEVLKQFNQKMRNLGECIVPYLLCVFW